MLSSDSAHKEAVASESLHREIRLVRVVGGMAARLTLTHIFADDSTCHRKEWASVAVRRSGAQQHCGSSCTAETPIASEEHVSVCFSGTSANAQTKASAGPENYRFN